MYCALLIQPWPDFNGVLLVSETLPSVVDGINDCIINYELAKLIGGFDGRVPPGKFISSVVTQNTIVPWYPYDIDLVSLSYLDEMFATAIHHLGVHRVRA